MAGRRIARQLHDRQGRRSLAAALIAGLALAGGASSQNQLSPGVRQLWDEGQELLQVLDWDAAEQRFRAILDAGVPALVPLAHIGIATADRGRRNVFAALARLRDVERLLPPLPAENMLVRMAWWQLYEELARCHVDLGLLDLARSECEQMESLAEQVARPAVAADEHSRLIDLRLKPVERFAAVQLGIDVDLGLMRWEAAVRKAQRALADAELIAPNLSNGPSLRLRMLMARECLATEPTAMRPVVDGFEQLLADPNLHPAHVFTARAHAAEDCVATAQFDRARIHAAAALAVTSPNTWDRCRADAIEARIAMSTGAAVAVLEPLRARLAESIEGQLTAILSGQWRPGGIAPFHFRTRRNSVSTLLTLDRRLLDGEAAVAAAFDHLERAFAVGPLARSLGASAATFDAVRQQLVPLEGGLLAWFAGPVGGHVLAIDRSGAVHAEFAADPQFAADLENARVAMAHAPTDAAKELVELRRCAVRLAERLLPASIRQRVTTWKRVIVVGDESLGASAWQVLPWEDGWFVLAKAVSHLPSASLGLALQQRARLRIAAGNVPTIDRVVVADPDMDAATRKRFDLEALALTAAQRAALVGAGAPERAVFFGSTATEAALSDPVLTRARTLSVVVHGVQDVDREWFAGLLLATSAGSDGILFADEVAKLHVPPFCVLGSCNASAGPRRIGDDGANHLGGAFLRAGADMVLVASGDLPLAATVELVAGVLAGREKGLDVVEALRQARVAVAASEGRTHPWYFAGLRAVGVEPVFH